MHSMHCHGRIRWFMMAVLNILLVLGIFWSCVAVFGINSKDYFGQQGPSLNGDNNTQKNDKLQEIRALSPFPKPPHGVQGNVCYTEGCIDASLALLRSMNFSVNPCEDFFQFTCGRWKKENPIPPSSSRWSQFHVVSEEVNRATHEILAAPDDPSDFKSLKRAKQFYADCVNTDAIEAEGVAHLLAILAQDGGWPAITQNWTSGSFDLFAVVAQVRREFMDSVLLNVYVFPDSKNTTRNLVYLDQPSFFFPRLILLNQKLFKPRIDAYVNYFVGVAEELANITKTPVVESELIAQANDIIAFETRLAEITPPDEKRLENERSYNPYKLNAYQEEVDRIEVVHPYAKVNYKSLLELIFLNSSVRSDEELIVKEKEYLVKYIHILDTTNIKTIANYVHWRIVSKLAQDTLQVFRDIKFKFDKVHLGISQPKPRSEICASTTLINFGMALSVKYIGQAFDEDAKTNVDIMVENLRKVFKDLLDKIDWMDDETRANAHKKVNAMRQFMAYPDWLFNQTRVEQDYEGLETVPGNYFRTTLSVFRWAAFQQYKTLRQFRDRNFWLTYPLDVNAYYLAEYNSIYFPAGFLQPPFYRIRGPESINYGGIGSVIGHEITHGFDKRGSQYDADGNAKNWWSEKILLRFREKSQCFIDQYSAYKTPVGNVSGNLTVTENVADNGGVRQSYLAYRNWIINNNGGREELRLPGLEQFTPDQLFFLGWSNIWCENISDEALGNHIITDNHSPWEFRVLGPLQNFQTFAEKWNCSAGSAMNPNHKCALW